MALLRKGIPEIRRRLRQRILSLPKIDEISYRKSIEKLNHQKYDANSTRDYIEVATDYDGHGVYQSIDPMQSDDELEALVEELDHNNNIEHALEIGTGMGGSLFIWSNCLEDVKKVVSVDIGYYRKEKEKFLKEFNSEIDIIPIRGDSKDEETFNLVNDSLSGSVDFLFIDADHSYRGAKHDFQMYKKLIDGSGIVAFHDINETDNERVGVPRLWEEISSHYDTKEIITSEEVVDGDVHAGGGIGIVYIN